MGNFEYTGLPMRVVFGAGSIASLGAEVERLGAKRALVLSTPGRGASVSVVTDCLGARLAGIYAKAVMHVPVEVAADARRVAEALGADCCIPKVPIRIRAKSTARACYLCLPMPMKGGVLPPDPPFTDRE